MPRPSPPLVIVCDKETLKLSGSLSGGGRRSLLSDLNRCLEQIEADSVKIDLAGVADLDSLEGAVLSEAVVRGRVLGKEVHIVNASPEVARNLERYFYPAPEVREPESEAQPIASLGEKAYSTWEAMGELLLLVSESFYWTLAGLWNPHGHRRGAVAAQALVIGVGALPVIALISFLVGIVMALQSAEQLRQFGANIFVADLVVIAMAREMGPLMTAILLAGRSGAAIAAEIASMTVNEEIDALRTMALNPLRYVVVPKIIGITITAPLLSILAVVVGIFGGFLVAVSALDLTYTSFINEAVGALYLKDIITGQVKSVVFAWLIVILAAYFGLRVKGGPEGVGRATTKAVVASIFAVIVADCALGLLFYL